MYRFKCDRNEAIHYTNYLNKDDVININMD